MVMWDAWQPQSPVVTFDVTNVFFPSFYNLLWICKQWTYFSGVFVSCLQRISL